MDTFRIISKLLSAIGKFLIIGIIAGTLLGVIILYSKLGRFKWIESLLWESISKARFIVHEMIEDSSELIINGREYYLRKGDRGELPKEIGMGLSMNCSLGRMMINRKLGTFYDSFSHDIRCNICPLNDIEILTPCDYGGYNYRFVDRYDEEFMNIVEFNALRMRGNGRFSLMSSSLIKTKLAKTKSMG